MTIDETAFEQQRAALGYTEARRVRWQKRNPEADPNVITDWRAFLEAHPFGQPWNQILPSGEWVETGHCIFVDGETTLEGEYLFWARAWAVRLCSPSSYTGLMVQGSLMKYDASSYWHLNLHNVYAEMRARVLETVQQECPPV
ncbi:MAG: hypothetical protein IKT85_01535 [Kiritimatiellae bacterium]|nr:hypothetical protein [Kiritimatiellia bacterium]